MMMPKRSEEERGRQAVGVVEMCLTSTARTTTPVLAKLQQRKETRRETMMTREIPGHRSHSFSYDNNDDANHNDDEPPLVLNIIRNNSSGVEPTNNTNIYPSSNTKLRKRTRHKRLRRLAKKDLQSTILCSSFSPTYSYSPLSIKRTKVNLFLASLSILLVFSHLVFCKPNNQQQQQQHQQQLNLADKQLVRKVPSSSNNNNNQNINNNQNNNNNNYNNDQQQEQSGSSANTQNGGGAFQCPEQFGYYTDSRDCTKYYVCVFGEVLHESCTGGLRFSRELQTCDWPRNVDCPNQLASNSSSSAATTSNNNNDQVTTTTTTPQTTTSTSILTTTGASASSTTITGTSTTSSSPGGSSSNSASTIGSSGSSKYPPQTTNDLKASLVFADEANDPQQPSFDEAISPVITADGAIHLHDGQGGTFGLGAAPQTNRALQTGSPAQQSMQAAGRQNVDVFVKPISVSSQPNRPAAGVVRSSQQQQQSLVQQSQQRAKLQAATLPARPQQQQPAREGGISDQFVPNPLSDGPSSSELSDESGDFSGNEDSISNNNNNNNNSDQDLGQPADSGDLDSPMGDAASAFQDQPNEPTSGSAGETSDDGGLGGPNLDGNSDDEMPMNQAHPANYIPPVLATQNAQFSNPNNQANLIGRQQQASSTLLSINNRQIVDPSRQSFKPILINSNNQQQMMRPQQQQQQFPAAAARNRNSQSNIIADNNNNNQFRQTPSGQQQQFPMQNNNRQSRMSSSQQQQFFPATNNATSARFQSFQQPRISSNSSNNNNINFNTFNDTSKPIRLASSQQLDNLSAFALSTPSIAGSPSQALSPQLAGTSNNPTGGQSQQGRFPASSPAQSNASRSQRQQLLSSSSFNTNTNNNNNNGAQSLPFVSSNNNNLNQNFASSLAAGQAAPIVSLDQFGSIDSSQSSSFSSNFPSSPFGQPQTSTTTSFASLPQLLQQQQAQQRRPRPPKRQQIPGNAIQSSALPRQTSPINSSNNNNQQQQTTLRRPPLLSNFELETTTFAPSLSATTSAQFETELTTALRNEQQFDPAPGQNQQQFTNNNNARPIVAPTTVTFQQPSQSQAGVARPRSNARPSSTIVGLQQTPTPTTSTTSTSTPASSAAPASSGADSVVPSDQANRFLQPGAQIDGLEAGQPFGTVDYDFDVLQGGPSSGLDNSTDTRRPAAAIIASTASQQQQQQSPASTTARGRQQQPAARARPGSSAPQQAVTAASIPSSSSPQQAGSNNNNNNNNNALVAAVAPTKKPRPTNKKIVVDHDKALANNRASSEPAKRPENIFSTPTPFQTATKCDVRHCRLPDCKCGDTLNPGQLEAKTIPQVVLLTFDDAVNDLNWEIYEELFSGRTNPNGCPILATFYVSHEWTDYGQVQTLYSRGHEMASHSVTHSFGEKFSKSQWFKEINGQREILNMYGGVKMQDVRGMRAPFLQIGGNKMFEMLYDANFTYDSSMPIFENSPPMWPYTLDYQMSHECMITPCPTKSYPGVWEVGMTMWVDLRGGRCSMGDACSNPSDEDGVYEMLMKNFNRHYKSNRAPFGLFYHSAWFNTVHHRRGFLRFLTTVNSLPDVFFVTNWQMLQWMRQPTPVSEINSFEPWQCPAKSDRPPPCYHPSVCNVKSEHGTRFMKTCQPCPANQQYPWVGATGFKGSTTGSSAGKQSNGSG